MESKYLLISLFSVSVSILLLLLSPASCQISAQESNSPSPIIITLHQGEKKEISIEEFFEEVQAGQAEAAASGIDFVFFDETKGKLIVDASLIQPVGAYFGKLTLGPEEIPLVVLVSEDNPPLSARIILKDNSIETGESLQLYFDIKTLSQIRSSTFVVKYEITDFNGEVLATHVGEEAFSTASPLFDTLQVPPSIQPGEYILIAEISHDESVIVTGELFEVNEKELLPRSTVTRVAFVILIVLGLVVLLLLISLFLLRKNIDFIVKNQPKKLEEIYREFIKTRKASDAISRLRKQLDILNKGRKLKVINKDTHEKTSRRIYSTVRRIERKYRDAPISSRSDEEANRLKHELSLIEQAYRLKSIKKGNYEKARKKLLKSINEKKGKKQ